MRLIGGLYGLVGLGGLVPFILLIVYGPPITSLPNLTALFWYAFPLFNSVVCVVIAYGFVTRKRWARGVAITYNGFWLIAMAFGIVFGRLAETPSAPWTRRASALVVVVGGFLIAVIILCSTERVKTLMRQ